MAKTQKPKVTESMPEPTTEPTKRPEGQNKEAMMSAFHGLLKKQFTDFWKQKPHLDKEDSDKLAEIEADLATVKNPEAKKVLEAQKKELAPNPSEFTKIRKQQVTEALYLACKDLKIPLKLKANTASALGYAVASSSSSSNNISKKISREDKKRLRREDILKAIGGSSAAQLDTTDIKDAAGAAVQTVTKDLEEMVEEGLLFIAQETKAGRGTKKEYALTEKAGLAVYEALTSAGGDDSDSDSDADAGEFEEVEA